MNGIWRRIGKPAFDFIVASTAILLLLPLLLIITALVRLKLGSPVFFVQNRLGIHDKEFQLYKFRSMTNARDSNGDYLPDEVRLTAFGKWLRSTSIDELPQLFNILRGDMSLIGPRATLPSYRERLKKHYPRRFEVLPGLTSLPAIRGRNLLSWDEKFQLDIEYVENLNFSMDAKIFFQTIPVVLGREGISMQGVATATKYVETQCKEKDGEF